MITKIIISHSGAVSIHDVSPPCIFKLVDGVVRIFLGGTQTQNSMILICCSLSTLAATVHHLHQEGDTFKSLSNIRVDY